ncbi:Hsp20/alpha crystallin family protein [Thalassospiraceae bacterium LMO-SO8]|nr:Hsp20/alpha crystallin family protein [Alphaproteobacteria bacterium LMO-S08]WND76145.1 Hsp20/alpha crystallin family protein [Thalassospiraceae bacterium LMO-SO8]
MSTTQQSTPEKKVEAKRAEGGEVSVKQDATTPAEAWRTDMERLMSDWFSAWSGLGRLQPFGGLPSGAVPPAAGLEEWRAQADRYFEDMNRRWADLARLSPLEMFGVPAGVALNPEVDVSDGDGKFVLKADLPGLSEGDVEVAVDGDVLTISGHKSETSEDKENDYCRRERRFGSFRRSFKLPEGVVGDKAKASFDKGVLTVTVPKQNKPQKSKGKKVPLND